MAWKLWYAAVLVLVVGCEPAPPCKRYEPRTETMLMPMGNSNYMLLPYTVHECVER
jgi:hypothetical protein